jgi:hypothetical protein
VPLCLYNLQGPTTLAALPVGDWQFWAVTLIALGAVLFLARPLLRKARGRDKEKPATLTIGGKAVEAKKGGQAGGSNGPMARP